MVRAEDPDLILEQYAEGGCCSGVVTGFPLPTGQVVSRGQGLWVVGAEDP